MATWLSSRSCSWWINEVGVLLEIVGALVVVVAAFHSRAKIKDIPDSYDVELATKLRDIIAAQAFTELAGFGLLAVGLLGQLIGAAHELRKTVKQRRETHEPKSFTSRAI